MPIQSVSLTNNTYQVIQSNGTVIFVPNDPSNSDYARIQAWIAAGGTVT